MTAHVVIQPQQLKVGSEIIVTLAGKHKVEVSILGKAAELEHALRSSDNLKDVTIQSMLGSAEIVNAGCGLGFLVQRMRG